MLRINKSYVMARVKLLRKIIQVSRVLGLNYRNLIKRRRVYGYKSNYIKVKPSRPLISIDRKMDQIKMENLMIRKHRFDENNLRYYMAIVYIFMANNNTFMVVKMRPKKKK